MLKLHTKYGLTVNYFLIKSNDESTNKLYITDFSYKLFLNKRGLEMDQSLTVNQMKSLMDELGVTDFLEDGSCSLNKTVSVLSTTNGWTNGMYYRFSKIMHKIFMRWKTKKYHTVGTIPKSNLTVIETECKLIPLAHIYYDYSLTWPKCPFFLVWFLKIWLVIFSVLLLSYEVYFVHVYACW